MTDTLTTVGGTEQSTLATFAVDGVTIGRFNTWEGGDILAPAAQYRSGGQRNQQSYQTLPKYSEITVGRVMNLAVDWELVRSLESKAGQVRATCTVQPLDGDLNAYGAARVATGQFLGISGIKGDSDSESISNFMLHMSVDSWA